MEAPRQTSTEQDMLVRPSFSFALTDFWRQVDGERLTLEATQKDDSMLGDFRMFPENGLPLLSGRRGMFFSIGGEPGPRQGKAIGVLVGDEQDWRNPPNGVDSEEEGRIHSACSYSLYGEAVTGLISRVMEETEHILSDENVSTWKARLAADHSAVGGLFRTLINDKKAAAAYKIAQVQEAVSSFTLVPAEPSLDCDCRAQGKVALENTLENGGWFMENCEQEGRGHGLEVKAAIYALQRKGLNSALACLALGIPWDVRDYSHNAEVLHRWSDDPTIKRDFRTVRLRSNNPRKGDQLRAAGITVYDEDHITGVTARNLDYLLMKASQGYRLQPDELRRLIELDDFAQTT